MQVTEGLVPSYSRDGQWIYFASERSGDWQVWKVPPAGGSAMQVTHEGGFAALEGLDGYLYYAKSRYPSPEVWRTPLAGGDEELVSEHLRPRTWSSWTVTRTGILFVEDVRNGKTTLSLYDPVRRVVRDVAPLQTAPFWSAATSDGKRAIMNDSASARSRWWKIFSNNTWQPPITDVTLETDRSVVIFSEQFALRSRLEFHAEWLRDEPFDATATGSDDRRCQLARNGEHEIRSACFFCTPFPLSSPERGFVF
jgi:hypothetical protein